MKRLKVFEAFAGYGSQSIALRNLGVDYEVVGISEIDPTALIAYAAIRDMELDCDTNATVEEMKLELINRNVGYDFIRDKNSTTRIDEKKLIKLYNAHKLSKNLGDISKINVEDIPTHDLFTYSFPCQDISVIGAGMGIEKGKTRSGLLYECEKVIEYHKPKYLLMENVKNLVGRKFKPQFDEWLSYLEGLGYTNHWEVLKASDFGIPQSRERVFVISVLGGHEEITFKKTDQIKSITDYLDDDYNDELNIVGELKERITKTKFHKDHYKEDTFNLVDGNIEGFRIMDYRYDEGLRIRKNNLCPTITTKGRGSLSGVSIIYNNRQLRYISEKESFRLMGLSDDDISKIQKQVISSSKQYKLAGNSIVVPVLEAIFKELFI